MALIQTGELLAVTTDTVTRRADGQQFDIKKLHLFDKDQSRTIEVSVGDRFPMSEFMDLAKLADSRPFVHLAVVVSQKGGLYLDGVRDVEMPAAAAAPGKP